MKLFVRVLMIVACLHIEVAFSGTPDRQEIIEPLRILPKQPSTTVVVSDSTAQRLQQMKDMTAFLNALGQTESSNRYDVVNRFGYLGKYQFGKRTLRGLGITVDTRTFLNSPDLQEEAMRRLLIHNRIKLDKYITQYKGKTLYGVKITESGVLAAAHLAGQSNVRKFFRSGKDFADGNGTKMTSYMRKCGGYSLKFPSLN